MAEHHEFRNIRLNLQTLRNHLGLLEAYSKQLESAAPQMNLNEMLTTLQIFRKETILPLKKEIKDLFDHRTKNEIEHYLITMDKAIKSIIETHEKSGGKFLKIKGIIEEKIRVIEEAIIGIERYWERRVV